MKKIFIMTDLEGVAGIVDFDNWCMPESRFNFLARELLTQEVNAAAEGFLAGGAEEILVVDAHGPGGIHPHLLDSRVMYMRGWADPVNTWPLSLDRSYDGVAFVGQHGKSGSHYSHLAHSGTFQTIDIRVNGVSIGEFGQLAMCASELGVPTFFGSGDYGFTVEAKALVPGIDTVWVKKGNRAVTGEDLSWEDYRRLNLGAIHYPPKAAREMIRAGAERAIRRVRDERSGIIPLKPPFEIVMLRRPYEKCPYKQVAKTTGAASVAAALNSLRTPDVWRPFVEDGPKR